MFFILFIFIKISNPNSSLIKKRFNIHYNSHAFLGSTYNQIHNPKIVIISQCKGSPGKAQSILQYEKCSSNVWSEIITSMSHKCDKDLSGIIEQSPIPANLFVIL